jgi:hypothetical protein
MTSCYHLFHVIYVTSYRSAALIYQENFHTELLNQFSAGFVSYLHYFCNKTSANVCKAKKITRSPKMVLAFKRKLKMTADFEAGNQVINTRCDHQILPTTLIRHAVDKKIQEMLEKWQCLAQLNV